MNMACSLAFTRRERAEHERHAHIGVSFMFGAFWGTKGAYRLVSYIEIKFKKNLVQPALCSFLLFFGLCGPLSLVPVASVPGRDVAFVALSLWPRMEGTRLMVCSFAGKGPDTTNAPVWGCSCLAMRMREARHVACSFVSGKGPNTKDAPNGRVFRVRQVATC